MGSRAKAQLENALFSRERRINHALKEGSSGGGEVKMDDREQRMRKLSSVPILVARLLLSSLWQWDGARIAH